MMKLSVGLSRKVSDNHYGSKGGNIGLEVEVDSILLGDPSRLRGYMKQLFDMVRKALDEELNDGRENNPDEPENPALKGAIAGHEVVKPEQNAAIRMASGKQELVRKAKIPFQPLLEERKVHALHELTLQQASGLITELKAMVG
jgi:hypothetical protein